MCVSVKDERKGEVKWWIKEWVGLLSMSCVSIARSANFSVLFRSALKVKEWVLTPSGACLTYPYFYYGCSKAAESLLLRELSTHACPGKRFYLWPNLMVIVTKSGITEPSLNCAIIYPVHFCTNVVEKGMESRIHHCIMLNRRVVFSF